MILSLLSFHLICIFSLTVSSLDLFKAVLCANFVRDSAEELLCASWYRERHSVGELCRVQSVPKEKWAWCMFNSSFFAFLFLCIIHPFFCFIVCVVHVFKYHFSLCCNRGFDIFLNWEDYVWEHWSIEASHGWSQHTSEWPMMVSNFSAMRRNQAFQRTVDCHLWIFTTICLP